MAPYLVALLLLAVAPPLVSGAAHDRAPVVIESVEPVDTLNEAFRGSAQWRGADGAYSFPVAKNRSLWLFGDTVIEGQKSPGSGIEDEPATAANATALSPGADKSTAKIMINNTAAWLDQTAPGELSMLFYWKIKDNRAASVLTPEQPGQWYWPGDGIVYDGKLYIFMKRVRRTVKAGPEEFQFDWYADDLLCLTPAAGDPTQWQCETFAVPEVAGGALFGTACVADKQYMYVYCSSTKDAAGLNAHPAIVARVNKTALPHPSPPDWQYWSSKSKSWLASQTDATILFADAAPEMTVSYLPSIHRYVAVYMPPLSDKILIRTALLPQGPFSDPVLVYKAPEAQIRIDGKSVAVYSAKAHVELSGTDDLIVTYCSNPGGIKEHAIRPDLYFPHALKVHFTTADH